MTIVVYSATQEETQLLTVLFVSLLSKVCFISTRSRRTPETIASIFIISCWLGTLGVVLGESSGALDENIKNLTD